MTTLPEHSRRVAERLLDAYCRRICPPEALGAVVLGFREGVAGDARAPADGRPTPGFTLHEIRRICGVPGTARLVDVAQLRWESRDGAWRLYHAEDADGAGPVRWRRYPGTRAERSVAALLRVFDADRCGLLWPRVNGASLRWCSSRGRCADCTERYLAALGAPFAGDPPADRAQGGRVRPISRA